MARLDGRHVLADLDSLSNHLVAYVEGTLMLASPASDGVHVRTTDATGFDLNVNVHVHVAEGLGLELVLSEFVPRLVGKHLGCP